MVAVSRHVPHLPKDPRPILVTGASGFVGSHLVHALKASGHPFIVASRRPERMREALPGIECRRLDLEDESTLRPALEGCRALVHLVHQMNAGKDYPEKEARAARTIAKVAEDVGLERIVFLGGPDPGPRGSKHLHSRLHAGELLRAGTVPAIELRAAMIIGQGSTGWDMIRTLAKRLPAMVLPRWAENHSWPVDIDDAVTALMAALMLPIEERVFDVTGPKRLTHREVLETVSRALGKAPHMVDVPVLTPRLSSYWITLITGIDLHLTQQLVAGVIVDLDPTETVIWSRTERSAPDFVQSVQRAVDEASAGGVSEERRERLRAIGRRYQPEAP